MSLLTHLLFLISFAGGFLFRADRPERSASRLTLALMAILIGRVSSFILSGPFEIVVDFIELGLVSGGSGILLGTILHRSRKKIRPVWIGLILLSVLAVFIEPLRSNSKVLIIPIAFLTGWTREVRGFARPGLMILTFAVFITALGNKGQPDGMPDALYETWRTFTYLTNSFLGIHCFFASFRLVVRFRPKVRKIGRSLLLSHLLAIVVPATLLSAFMLLAGLASIASYRAESTVRHLEEETNRTGAMLHDALIGEAGRGEADLERLADKLRLRFRDEPDGRAILAASIAPGGETERFELSLLPGAERDRIDDGPDANREGWLLPAETWLKRPPSTHGVCFAEARLLMIARAEEAIPGGGVVRVELIREIPAGRLLRLERVLNTPIRLNPLLLVATEQGGVQMSGVDDETERKWEEEQPAIDEAKGGSGFSVPGAALAPALEYDGESGDWSERTIVVSSRAYISDLFTGITTFRENRMNTIALVAFIFLALLFLVVVTHVLGTVVSMNRSIAGSIGRLTKGTRKLREGELEHRIEIQGEDELARLGAEFNRMAEGLEEGRRLALEKERVEQELAIAREIQQKLLPGSPPQIPGLEVAGLSIPAREVGGDYYDFILSGDGGFGVAIADVSGKGVPAALLMSSLRASLRAQAADRIDPAETTTRLNGFICESTKTENFITGFFGAVDGGSGEVRFANAGHEPPLLLRAGGDVETVMGGGLILGAFADVSYEEMKIRLEKGDLMLLYTDGVTEAMNGEEEFYGDRRLKEELKRLTGLPVAEVLDLLIRSVREFTAGAEQSDDITLLAVRRV